MQTLPLSSSSEVSGVGPSRQVFFPSYKLKGLRQVLLTSTQISIWIESGLRLLARNLASHVGEQEWQDHIHTSYLNAILKSSTEKY